MKKNKGFTLIELLAVIVILAVIALIATPIIMNVINDSKKGAAKDAMFGYVKAVELAATKTITATTGAPSGTYIVKDGDLYQNSTKILDVDFKGTKPKDSEGSIQLLNGLVVEATLTFDNVKIKHRSSESYSIGEEVFFDPTGVVADCKPGKEWTPMNPGTTCYKWNVIKDNRNSIEMLLDHNTTAKIAWNSSGNSEDGPKEVYNQLKTDTNNWSKVETLTSNDNVTLENASDGTYTINYNGMKARLISGQEITDIGGDAAWSTSNYTGTIYSNQAWIYRNLSSADSTVQPFGYWTDTARLSNRTSAWVVYYTGYLNDNYTANNVGVRPVVRILKSNI